MPSHEQHMKLLCERSALFRWQLPYALDSWVGSSQKSKARQAVWALHAAAHAEASATELHEMEVAEPYMTALCWYE